MLELSQYRPVQSTGKLNLLLREYRWHLLKTKYTVKTPLNMNTYLFILLQALLLTVSLVAELLALFYFLFEQSCPTTYTSYVLQQTLGCICGVCIIMHH